MAEAKQLNLMQRMSLVEQEIETVAKNIELGKGKNSYRAVSEKDVKKAVKPLEAKYGVKSIPGRAEIVEAFEMKREGYEGKIRMDFFVRIKLQTHFINVDDPNEQFTVETFGDGVDPMDKAVGKATTYAYKYALMNAYKIETGEDPDEEMSQERYTKPKPTNDKTQAKSLYLYAVKVYGQTDAEKLLKNYVKDMHNIESLSDLKFDKMGLKEMQEDLDRYIDSKKLKREEPEGLDL